jgi:putative tricarboxylic transport membrane protein
MVLFLLIAPLSDFVLKLGPTEMFMIVLWGITLIASVQGEHMLKALLSGFIGLLLGTFGYSEIGVERGTFGIDLLLDGIPVVPAMIGMFAASELFSLLKSDYIIQDVEKRKVSIKKLAKGLMMSLSHPLIILRGSFIGLLIGAVPGVGSSVSNLISYMETKRRAPDAETFGRGNPKGVVASESANSSSEAGSMATLLALGIPGGGATAIMLAAFMMHNITGGPSFIRNQTDIVYAIIIANFGQAVLLLFLGLLLIPLLTLVIKVPIKFLVPSVLSLAIFGAYGISGSMMGPITVAIASIVGWLLKRYSYSVPAMVIGLILGYMAESELLHSYQISGGQITYLFTRPMTILIFILLILSLLSVPIKNNLSKIKNKLRSSLK